MTNMDFFGVFGAQGGCFGAGFGLYLGVRLFMLKKFVLGGMVVVAALLGNACGDDGSSDSPAGPEDSEVSLSSSSDDVVSSSSEKNEAISSSHLSSSSSKKAVSNSSSSNEKSSSSSGKVESSSSGKGEKSSSSEGAAGSSSSDVVVGSSSSEKSSSSVAESSSSVESSSSEKPSSSSVVESSSSVAESSSSGEDNVSSSSEYYKSSWTYLNKNITYDTIIDSRDNQVYKILTIGEQTWMAENLNYYDTIQMPELKQHSWCYKDKEDNCELYGRLYDLTITLGYDSTNTTPAEYLEYGEKDSSSIQGICPQGFVLPTISDFEVLKNNYVPKQLVSSGTNSSGMSVVVKNMGYRNTYQEINYTLNKPAFWTVTYEWASSKDGRVVYFRTANSEYYYDDNTSFNQSYAVSVRCLKRD